MDSTITFPVFSLLDQISQTSRLDEIVPIVMIKRNISTEL